MKVALICETGEAREVHHMCVLLGYGADAICPYLVFETVAALREEGIIELADEDAYRNYFVAMETGIAKVMAKMGISTLQSYKGAQIFEAVGLGEDVIELCFKNTPSRVGGISFNVLADEALERHSIAFNKKYFTDQLILRNPGFYHWRSGGEKHINDPMAIASLQEAVSGVRVLLCSEIIFLNLFLSPLSTTGLSQLPPGVQKLRSGDAKRRQGLRLARPARFCVRHKGRPAGRGGAGGEHRQALLHRRHVLWLH